MKFSNSNSFYPNQKDYDAYDLPFFWMQSIVQTIQLASFQQADPQVVMVTGRLSDLSEIKWVQVSAHEYQEMVQRLQNNSPEARQARVEDAKERGDSVLDVNPIGHNNNCGYCVLAYILDEESAERLRGQDDFMEQFDHPDWLDLGQIAAKISEQKQVGAIQACNSKQQLRDLITAKLQHVEHATYVCWIPKHFLVIQAETNHGHVQITIVDPQADNRFDLDLLPEGQSQIFLVED